MSRIASVRKTPARLADGRELIYFGAFADSPDPYTDTRVLESAGVSSQARYDPLLDEWVLITGHRMGRTHLPPDTECPLCPSRPGRPTEIPASWYQVAVFQNRFPALTQEAGHETEQRPWPLRLAAGKGRCEVVVFSPDHDASFADLSPAQAGTGQSVTVQGTIEGYPYGTATAKVTLS